MFFILSTDHCWSEMDVSKTHEVGLIECCFRYSRLRWEGEFGNNFAVFNILGAPQIQRVAFYLGRRSKLGPRPVLAVKHASGCDGLPSWRHIPKIWHQVNAGPSDLNFTRIPFIFFRVFLKINFLIQIAIYFQTRTPMRRRLPSFFFFFF